MECTLMGKMMKMGMKSVERERMIRVKVCTLMGKLLKMGMNSVERERMIRVKVMIFDVSCSRNTSSTLHAQVW